MAVHRCWALNLRAKQNPANTAFYLAVSCVEFRKTAGVGQVPTNGKAYATDFYPENESDQYGPQNVFNLNSGLRWLARDNTVPKRIGYDYGAGNEKSVVQVAIKARSDQSGAAPPLTFDLQYSDDGFSFVTLASFTAQPWSPGQQQIFDVPLNARVGSPKRVWAINCTGLAPGSDVYGLTIGEMEFRETAGVTQTVAGGTPFATDFYSPSSYPKYGPPNAFAGDPSQVHWVANGPDVPKRIWYDFGAGNEQDVAEVVLAARGDVGPDGAPALFDLEYSDDGFHFTVVKSFTAQTWTQGSVQTFAVTVPPPPASGSSGAYLFVSA